MLEYSLIGIKPDAFVPNASREEGSGLKKPLPENPKDFIAELQAKIRSKGLEIIMEKTYIVPENVAGEHYAEHKGVADAAHGWVSKYDFLLWYLTSGPSYWMIVHWENAIRLGREAIVEIREEYLQDRKKARYNMTHGSDSTEWAKSEILLHFPGFEFK